MADFQVLSRADAPRARAFVYEEAFSRTLGWVTPAELQVLRSKRAAIGGLGGVGGAHAVTLARLGIGAFRLADFDVFDLANFNRQYGATMSNLDRPKADVIAETVRDINPQADVDQWNRALTPEDAPAFLDGADIYIDSIDFFALEVRRALFAEARARNIPAVTAAPIGTGAAWLIFTGDSMSFEDYFAFTDDGERNYLRFLVGLAPRSLHRPFLADPSQVDFKRRKAPSTPMGISLCAGVAATEAMRLLLGREGIKPAPWFHQFDVQAGRSVSARAWFGGNNPLRRLKIRVVRNIVESKADRASRTG